MFVFYWWKSVLIKIQNYITSANHTRNVVVLHAIVPPKSTAFNVLSFRYCVRIKTDHFIIKLPENTYPSIKHSRCGDKYLGTRVIVMIIFMLDSFTILGICDLRIICSKKINIFSSALGVNVGGGYLYYFCTGQLKNNDGRIIIIAVRAIKILSSFETFAVCPYPGSRGYREFETSNSKWKIAADR